MVIYWVGLELFLIDFVKMVLVFWQVILILVGLLLIGWLVYDMLCKLWLGEMLMLLMFLLFVLFLVMGYSYNQVFIGWVIMLYLGVFIVMIMMVNVFLIIMLNQCIVVVDLKVGCVFDLKYGKIVKLCLIYNNYLMLFVVFLMLLNYYLLVFVLELNWVIVGLIFLMGVIIWYFFNIMYVCKGYQWWIWVVIVIFFIIVMWFLIVLMFCEIVEQFEVCFLIVIQIVMIEVFGWEFVFNVVMGCCSMCYVCEFSYEGIYIVFKGVFLEIFDDIICVVCEIYIQVGVINVMLLVNVSFMEFVEWQVIMDWYCSLFKIFVFN